jgi:hypothetical protein
MLINLHFLINLKFHFQINQFDTLETTDRCTSLYLEVFFINFLKSHFSDVYS